MSGSVEDKIIGTLVNVNDKFYVEVDKKHIPYKCPISQFPIINMSTDVLVEQSKVICKLICTYKEGRTYRAYVYGMVESTVDIEPFVELIKVAVTNRMNQENLLYGKCKDSVSIDDISTKTRRREVVVCRNIAIYFTNEYLGKQLDFSDISDMYNKDRTMMYRSIDNIKDYRLDIQLKNILTDLEEEIELIYNNLKEEE